MQSETRVATLECAGNSRVFLVPSVPGAQWELGAVSNAEWTGVPLRALLERAVLERHPWWGELQAVRKGNLAFADGNLFFNRSGMTISQTAEIIAEILHGVTFGTPTDGVHWRRVPSMVAQA